MSLADKIIKIRLDNKLSKEQFAEDLFVTVIDVEKWEQGYSIPDDGMLNIISTRYKVPLDYLLDNKLNKNSSQSEERKTLAKRSTTFCVSSIIGVIVIVFSTIVMCIAATMAEEPLFILFLLMFIGISFYFFYNVVKTLKLPKIVMEYNKDGIFLNHLKGLFIPYESIIKCKVRHAKSKHHVHHYGNIIIETENETYKVGVIDEIDDVLQTIMSNKYKSSN